MDKEIQYCDVNLPKIIILLNVTLHPTKKNPKPISVKLNKLFLKLIWNDKGPRRAKML